MNRLFQLLFFVLLAGGTASAQVLVYQHAQVGSVFDLVHDSSFRRNPALGQYLRRSYLLIEWKPTEGANLNQKLAVVDFYTTVDVDGTGFKNFVSFVGFLIPLIAFVLLGVMATNVIGVRVVAAFDQLLLRVPLVSFLYKSLKQVIDAFKATGTGWHTRRNAALKDWLKTHSPA